MTDTPSNYGFDGENVTLPGNVHAVGYASFDKPAQFTTGLQFRGVARTATTAGDGEGTITDNTSFIIVTSDSADKIIILPTPTPGNIVWLMNGGTGYELRSSDPATIAINGGTESNAESAIGANVLVRLFCNSATTWIGKQYSTAGTESAVQVAAAA